MKTFFILAVLLLATAANADGLKAKNSASATPSSTHTPSASATPSSTPTPSQSASVTSIPIPPSPSTTPWPNAPVQLSGIKFQALELLPAFALAKNNFTEPEVDNVFVVSIDAIVEVESNGTAVRPPVVPVGGQWHFLKYQHENQTEVYLYSAIMEIGLLHPVEIDIVVAVARADDTVFYTIYGNHTLQKNDVKMGVMLGEWPFLSSDNSLNITFGFLNHHINGTDYSTSDDELTSSEFGLVDDDDADVLHVQWETEAVVDDTIFSNITTKQLHPYPVVIVQIPSYTRYAYYDPLIYIAPPNDSGSDHTVLIVVLSVVGGVLLLAVLAVVAFVVWRKRRQNYEIIE